MCRNHTPPPPGKHLRPAPPRWHNILMPLDVQPLSSRRHLLMILVMLGLLGGSLGLAEVLVQRHGSVLLLSVGFPPPPGVEEVPVNDSVDALEAGDLDAAEATWPQGQRYFLAFFLDVGPDADVRQYTAHILSQVLPETPTRAIRLQSNKTLAGHPAMEAEAQISQGPNAAFAILRLATVEDRIVAFCFSGDGVMTDADKQFFDHYCTRQIRIRLQRPPRG
jgi:hypothetical protein